jgi:hypothetical protein
MREWRSESFGLHDEERDIRFCLQAQVVDELCSASIGRYDGKLGKEIGFLCAFDRQ